MYELDKIKALRKAPQLTRYHVEPNMALKMKVSLAAQVFSLTTSAAMIAMVEDLSPTAANTARLLHIFNDVFDFLNSRALSEVGSRRVAMKQLWSNQRENIIKWINFIDGISFISLKGKRRATKTLPFKKKGGSSPS